MISEAQMKDIKKRMAERKKQFNSMIKKVTKANKSNFGSQTINKNKELSELSKKNSKMIYIVSSKRPNQKTMPKIKEKRPNISIFRSNRPMKALEV